MKTMTIFHFGDFSYESISGKDLDDIHAQLCKRLSVAGTRTLTAADDWDSSGNPLGASVTASLYPEKDEIVEEQDE